MIFAKILDFGLATIQGGEMLTKADLLGTIAYMSPSRQRAGVDHRSDLFLE
jgi:serine/threonine protein kinase